MAVIIQTSFEDYADGSPPNEWESLAANGWDTTSGDIGVSSTGAHTGTKSVFSANGSGALQWPSGYRGRSVTMQIWANIDSTPSVPAGGGPFMHIASDLGSLGVDNWVVGVNGGAADDVDLRLNVFGVEVGIATNVLVRDVYQKFRMEVLFSTVNQAGTDVNADGCIKVYVNDVLVISAPDIRVAATSVEWASGLNRYDSLFWNIGGGFMDDVLATDDVVTCTDTDTPPPNDSAPCCGTKPDPELGPNPGDPTIPLQPWARVCAGGGIVPTAADVVDVESWSL